MAADTPEPRPDSSRAEPVPAQEPARDQPAGHQTVRVPVGAPEGRYAPDGHPPDEAPPKSRRR
jgi:hypothetical protein